MNSTTKTLAAFIEEHGLSMEAEWADRNPHMTDMPPGSTHWLCTFRRAGSPTAKFAITFSMGPAHTREPEIGDVLQCVADDITGVENAPDWLDWAEEFGFAEEGASGLRRARTTHDAIRVQAIELHAFLGEDAFEDLLWNVERQ